jgi:hypothetical protein
LCEIDELQSKFEVKKIFLLLFTTASVLILNAQEIPLKTLYNIYKLNSIDSAYGRLKQIKGFSGQLKFDSTKKSFIINGNIGNSTLLGELFKGRIKMVLTIYKSKVYEDVYAQAQAKFFSNSDYARGSKGITRYMKVYSDTKEMNDGDLWLILTECYKRDKLVFYELELRKYPYNDTD